MAIGAVLFSLPIALLSTFLVSTSHGYSATEAIAVYSTLGFLTFGTVISAIALSSTSQE